MGLTTCVAVVLSVVGGLLPDCLGKSPFSKALAQPAPRKPVVAFVMGVYEGRVTDVTEGSIHIEGCGTQPCGLVLMIEGYKQFAVSSILMAGGFERNLGGGDMYRLRDVLKGDKILIRYSRIDGVDTCTHICILRRPGGRVPPSPGEDSGRAFRHHDSMNAAQAREEKAIVLLQFAFRFLR